MKYCLFLLAIVASGQQVDRRYHLTANGTTEVRDNRDVGCLGWAMDVTNNGFSALTVTLQSAVDNATWITFNGTTVSGSNPLTATGYYTATGFLPFVRVNVTGISGTGSVDINLQCWKSPNYLAILGGAVIVATGTQYQLASYTSSTSLGGITVAPCNDVGGLHLNFDTTQTPPALICGVTAGSYPKGILSWGPGVITDGNCNTNTFTLLNALVGDTLIWGVPTLPTAAMAVSMVVSAADTVTIAVCNFSGSNQTVATGNWSARLIK